MHTRREFGQRLLAIAGATGLRSIGLASVLSSGCNDASGGGPGATRASGGSGGSGGALGAGTPEPVPSSVSGSGGGAPEVTPPQAPTAPKTPRVVIVGSGYGAAVTALRLTERGFAVTIIEMGRMWDKPGSDGKLFCAPFSPDGRAMWFRDKTAAVIRSFGPISTAFSVPKQAGIIDLLGNENMAAYVGRGVGGGSLVNMSIYVEPVQEVFSRAFPDVDAREMYATYYPRAKAQLRAAKIPEKLAYQADAYQYGRVGKQAAEAVGISVDLCTSGYDYGYMEKEVAGLVPKSALGGEALYGNNYGKRSLDQTYLAEAMGTGLLTIVTLTQVLKIWREPSGDYGLRCRSIDVDGNVLSEDDMTCSHLFLGGGSFGSTELLVRARETGTLPDLNEHVGTAWGPNSDIFVGRSNPFWQPTGAVQASVPGMSFRTRDQDNKAVFSMVIPFPAGIETFFSFNIVMTENPEAGSFYYDSSSDKVLLRWDVAQNQPAVKSTRFVFDKINRAAGTSYAGDFGGSELADHSTYHPVGGCPLGRATDSYGRVRNYQGLYVMDSSLIPVGIGANPALTTAALAERNVERILAEDLA
jgi:cholesterol oxidase